MEERHGDIQTTADLGDGKKGPWTNKYGSSLEDGKIQRSDLSPKVYRKKNAAFLTPWF